MITITKKSRFCDVDIKLVQGVTGIHYVINGEELPCVHAWDKLVALHSEGMRIPSKILIEIASSIVNAVVVQNKRDSYIVTDDTVIV